jgi:hypothetical protein
VLLEIGDKDLCGTHGSDRVTIGGNGQWFVRVVVRYCFSYNCVRKSVGDNVRLRPVESVGGFGNSSHGWGLANHSPDEIPWGHPFVSQTMQRKKKRKKRVGLACTLH